MKKKIIIIGKKSFIGNNLFFFLKNKFEIKLKDFKSFISLEKYEIKKFDYIINCSINHKYINNTYSKSSDFDVRIANKIKNFNCKFIFLSTRKVYKSAANLGENSKIQPDCIYSQNKLKTEIYLKKILKNKILILRVSNLIGQRFQSKSKRKIHYTFIDHFFEYAKTGVIFDNKKIYKDFLSIQKFSEIIEKLIINDVTGTFNVSLGRKVFLNELVKWLNYYNKTRCIFIKTPNHYNKDCFFLNNNRLKERINIKITLSDLKKYCKNLSKNYFLK